MSEPAGWSEAAGEAVAVEPIGDTYKVPGGKSQESDCRGALTAR